MIHFAWDLLQTKENPLRCYANWIHFVFIMPMPIVEEKQEPIFRFGQNFEPVDDIRFLIFW